MVENNVSLTNNKVKLLICYHKPSYLLKDEVLTPIHVGRANAKKRMDHNSENYKWLMENMIGDDTGDNLSERNDSYNEMTALYWAWKNYDELGNPDYIGLMHYRRHFIFNDELNDVINLREFDADTYLDFLNYSEEKMSDFVEGYDFIPHMGRVGNVYHHYIQNQRKEDIDLACQIVLELYPEYEETMRSYFAGSESNFCNMCIFKKELFFEYCEWIFSIMQEFENRVDMSQKRFFISERLTGMFVHRLMNKQELKYKKLPIVFLDEPTTVPIALYVDEEESTTAAIDLMSMLESKDEYSIYKLNIFCKKELKKNIKDKIRKYIKDKEKCIIEIIGVEENPEILPLYLERYMPSENKCIYISGKVLTLHDMAEFYRICSVDDYLAVGIPADKYEPAEKNKRIDNTLIVLNLKRMRLNHILDKYEENLNKGNSIDDLNKAIQGEIGYIPDYFFVSEHIEKNKAHVLSYDQKRAEIQANVIWHKFMIYDELEPEFNCQGIYSQFWWDYLRKIPFEFQKLEVAIESLNSLLLQQQREINSFHRGMKTELEEEIWKQVEEWREEVPQQDEEWREEIPQQIEEWRNYNFWGKLNFYYKHNGLKQTIKYAWQKITKGGSTV